MTTDLFNVTIYILAEYFLRQQHFFNVNDMRSFIHRNQSDPSSSNWQDLGKWDTFVVGSHEGQVTLDDGTLCDVIGVKLSTKGSIDHLRSAVDAHRADEMLAFLALDYTSKLICNGWVFGILWTFSVRFDKDGEGHRTAVPLLYEVSNDFIEYDNKWK